MLVMHAQLCSTVLRDTIIELNYEVYSLSPLLMTLNVLFIIVSSDNMNY